MISVVPNNASSLRFVRLRPIMTVTMLLMFFFYVACSSSYSSWFVVEARPAMDSRENEQSYWVGYTKGLAVGFETFVSLLGYWEEDDVKDLLQTMVPPSPPGVISSTSDDDEDDDDKDEDDDDDDDDGYYSYDGDESYRQEIRKQLFEVDPKDEHWKTRIKIACMGHGRTGSTSLALALEYLGYTVFHDDEHTEETDLFEAFNQNLITWADLNEILGLRGYNVTFKTAGRQDVRDMNHKRRQQEIIERSKNVAVGDENENVINNENDDDDDDGFVRAILTVRDNSDRYVQSWLQAARFYTICNSVPFKWMKTVRALLPALEDEYRVVTTSIFRDDEDEENENDDEAPEYEEHPDEFMNPEVLKKSYESYNRRVRMVLGNEENNKNQNLFLEFNVKQGWDPLCEFLNIAEDDCPSRHDVPFPHVHTRAKLKGENDFLYFVTVAFWPVVMLGCAIVVHSIFVLLRRVCRRSTTMSSKPKKE